MKRSFAIVGLISAQAFLATAGLGQGVPAPYTMRLQTFATGLNRPILARGAGDGSRRLFVVQQGGIIRVFQPGATTSTVFIDLSSKVVAPTTQGDERGLLGMTFHPQFAANGLFYVNYTRIGDGVTIVSEYRTTGGTGGSNTGDITSERILLTVPQPFSNHNGGMIDFGPDGYLYIGMGDGGSQNDPGNRAQNRSLLLGKLLRIDVNIPQGSPVPYLIPPTNPFTGQDTARCDSGSTTAGLTCQEIWTIGLRNPWRWSFDPQTGQMWVGDVGQTAIEEVNVVTSGGGNLGWRVYEGTQCTNLDPGLCTPGSYTMPLFQYTHTAGRCSLTGGYVYRGALGSLPAGAYVHGDYCTGEIWYWNGSAQVLLQDTPRFVVSFGRDDDGEIYVCYSNVSGSAQIDKIVRAKASADVDGDLRSDIAVFRPSQGIWYAINSSNQTVRQEQFGANGDIVAPKDHDGDNITDLGYFRPGDGTWTFLRSSNGTFASYQWGQNGDVPVAGDYDGDARADVAVFRPSTGVWYILRTSDGGFTPFFFGQNGDRPVAGDYDGDGKYDVAVFRDSNGTWYRMNSTDRATFAFQWGLSGDLPAQGDFDNDGRLDLGAFRPSTGIWYILLANGSFQGLQWGIQDDVPVVGDYDGDGRDDVAVFRPSNGTWYVIRSSGGFLGATWGLAGDAPAPQFDTP
jgi:glucose/arabinose dehydrogenase